MYPHQRTTMMLRSGIRTVVDYFFRTGLGPIEVINPKNLESFHAVNLIIYFYFCKGQLALFWSTFHKFSLCFTINSETKWALLFE